MRPILPVRAFLRFDSFTEPPARRAVMTRLRSRSDFPEIVAFSESLIQHLSRDA